jgi:hypothetical protein
MPNQDFVHTSRTKTEPLRGTVSIRDVCKQAKAAKTQHTRVSQFRIGAAKIKIKLVVRGTALHQPTHPLRHVQTCACMCIARHRHKFVVLLRRPSIEHVCCGDACRNETCTLCPSGPHAHTHTYTHTQTHTDTHPHTHTLFHTHGQTNWCTSLARKQTHSHTHTLTHTRTCTCT